ncbi:MAG: hypothetical protein U9R37_03195 [Campylobacterota bacterium]|nr:hypothetical protein [Campylobacterota bacterium]
MKKNLIILLAFIVIATVIINTSDLPSQTGVPESGKAKRIECQKKTTTFERSFGDEEIKIAQDLLMSGNFSFTSSIEKSIYSESKLFEYVKLQDTDKIVNEELKKYIKSDIKSEKNLKFRYNIYENDIKDPGKKTKKSKLYAGYVWFEFKNENNKTIYKVQIDFMDKKGADIANSIRCCIKSFMTYNK